MPATVPLSSQEGDWKADYQQVRPCGVCLCWTHPCDLLVFDSFMDEVILNVNMFGTCVKFIIIVHHADHRFPLGSYTTTRLPWSWVYVIYSASVLNNTSMYYFFKLQDIAPLPIWNEYPEIECQCFWPAQSASQYPSTRVLVHPPKVNHRSLVHPR